MCERIDYYGNSITYCINIINRSSFTSKAESASQIIQGGTSDLFANRKERGFELFVTRITYILGFTFFVLCLIISL